MIRWPRHLFALTTLGCALPLSADGQSGPFLRWERLPAIPDPTGFAGSFAGIDRGTILVAGGANFPDKMPWNGGTKVWHDRIFALEQGAASWRAIGRLPEPNGYGVSVSTPQGVLLVGGGNAGRNFTQVLRLTVTGENAVTEKLPDLPAPLALLAGAALGRIVYVAGGLNSPTAAQAQTAFLALDLDDLPSGWKELPAWPGPPRMLATAAVHAGSFYLIGGADLHPGPDGNPVRTWLRDAYCYTPGSGWRRIADLPRPAVAAAAPSIAGKPGVFVLGGDDGTGAGALPAAHPGFPRTILAYDADTDTWREAGTLPFSLVTTTAVMTGDRVIIPGGEARPGVRSNEVWCGYLATH